MDQTDMHSLFGSKVFNDAVMLDRLPRDVYRALRKTMEKGTTWSLTLPTWWQAP